jgi:hypothetical protein
MEALAKSKPTHSISRLRTAYLGRRAIPLLAKVDAGNGTCIRQNNISVSDLSTIHHKNSSVSAADRTFRNSQARRFDCSWLPSDPLRKLVQTASGKGFSVGRTFAEG